jgi:tetratricopeptide (TPR) repeat protein
MSKDNRKWVDWIKELPSWVKGAIGFITVVVGFVLLWQDNPDIFPPVLLGLFVVGGILGSLYLGFKRTEPLIVGGKGTWQYPHLRRWAIVSFILISLSTVAGTGYYFYERIQPPDKIIILVAEFDGPEQKNYRVTETVLSALRQALKDYDDVTIEALRKTITEQQGSEIARAEGEKQKATIVIWGWYGVTENAVPLSVHFEILRAPQHAFKLRPEIEGAVRTIDRAELESFDLQSNLSGEMAYLSLLTVGVTRYTAEDWNGAITAFDAALTQTTENIPPISRATAYFYIGNSRLSTQANRDESLSSSVNPVTGEAYIDNQGIASADQDVLKEVIIDYTNALELNPDFGNAYFNRGAVYMALMNWNNAKYDFTKAISLNFKNDSEAYNFRGNIYVYLGNLNAASDDFTKSIQINPNIDKYYFNRGNVYSQQGELEKANKDYNKAIELNPDSIFAYIGRGNIRQYQSDFEGAIADFNKAIELAPKDATIYNNRGNAFFFNGDIEEAITDYNKAIELDPSFPEPHFGIGYLRQNQGDFENAIAEYSKAIEINPNYALAYNNRAIIRKAQGDVYGAIADYTKSIQITPDDINTYINRGNAYAQKGDYDRAIIDYTKSIQLGLDDPRIFFSRANAYDQKGDYDNAIADYTKYIELVPDSVNGYNNRCWVYYKMSQYEEALPDCEKAIQLDPNNEYSLDSRAFVYEALGRTNDAIKDFELILEISSNQELRKRAEDELKKIKSKN